MTWHVMRISLNAVLIDCLDVIDPCSEAADVVLWLRLGSNLFLLLATRDPDTAHTLFLPCCWLGFWVGASTQLDSRVQAFLCYIQQQNRGCPLFFSGAHIHTILPV